MKTKKETFYIAILFNSGQQRIYHVYADNIACQSKFRDPRTHKRVNGLRYLMSYDVIWTFTHMTGDVCLNTKYISSINVESGQIDSALNPLSNDCHYNNPLN